MLYFLLKSYLEAETVFSLVLPSVLSLALIFWIYGGVYAFRRYVVRMSPCVFFSGAVLMDVFCSLELLLSHGTLGSFKMDLFRRFLDGGFEKHAYTFGGFFLLFSFIGILLCISSDKKLMWRTLLIDTTLGMAGGLALLLAVCAIYYSIVIMIVLIILLAIFFSK